MQFSESWLRTLIDPPLTSEALAHALTMAGLEVEEIQPVAPRSSGVVVAKVLELAKHPNADRLNVCQVDAGTGEILNIVCGAPNVAPGIKVPCALPGALLPASEAGGAPFQIKVGKLRGVESHGMLCSARELKLSEDHSGLMLLADDAPIGQDIREYLDLDDKLFTVKLTPNKADCLSMLGIAREVQAITGATNNGVPVTPVQASINDTFPVRISDPSGCGRFAGRVIRGVNAKAATPGWMIARLERAGQRSISALVDITNYVMLELGQPLHVYDLNKLQGGIDVRFGRSGETLKLLNDQIVELDSTTLAITDESGPIGLAGMMGGNSTKAELGTEDIFLESAFFFPAAIQGRSRRFNLSSDASHRFERGVDFAGNVVALERATRLVLDICGGQPGPVADLVAQLPLRNPVRLRVSRAAKILGVPVSTAEVGEIFARLGLSCAQIDADVFEVTPPSYRFDLEIEEDLIEEVARIHGFERIPSKPPVAANAMRRTDEARRSLHTLRHELAGRGYQETVNFSFVDAEWERDFAANETPIKLINPIASHLAVMRSTLIGGLLQAVRYNLNRKASRARVFEIGRVYHRDSAVETGPLSVQGIRQPLTVGALAYGSVFDEQWGVPTRLVDYFDVKGDLEALLAPAAARFVADVHPGLHPGRSARIEIDGRSVGWIGELHPRWLQKYEFPHAPVLFEIEAEALFRRAIPAYQDISKFPPVVRDVAVVVSQAQPAQALLDEMLACVRSEQACADVQSIVLFDEFRPKAGMSGGLSVEEKSLAFRVTLQNAMGTLQDESVDRAIAALIDRVITVFEARLRT
ncbi:phenylalanine--tRNA ligase subunit beta [Pandoraea sp.]|uniref:phenylalanine--tRNA ligase subunit beta n=1 Tax=Pandoraea sp. TaxID=1883445 RepID=UPI001226DF20|nr:phenylalanine--tRNA ligase subunit beta [Pandoraea sp.]TAL54789.1 MAG: phenylalanine--tRNA ligase subunit beta [Pandoraea sp.]TAM18443.1 MAG: phenylalanine--tRNA ligase subunit beta [Pandoraea sp.]